MYVFACPTRQNILGGSILPQSKKNREFPLSPLLFLYCGLYPTSGLGTKATE
jgi:hypothetical protein